MPIIDLSKYFSDNSGSLTYSVASSAEIIASVSGSTLSMVASGTEWTGSTAIVVTATDAAGNETSVSVAVTVTVKTADAMTVNLSQCSLYPNPTSDIFIISNVEPGAAICIKNVNGQIISCFIMDSASQAIDISSLATGIYYVTIQNAARTETQIIDVR